jgi:hypothetical protein
MWGYLEAWEKSKKWNVQVEWVEEGVLQLSLFGLRSRQRKL